MESHGWKLAVLSGSMTVGEISQTSAKKGQAGRLRIFMGGKKRKEKKKSRLCLIEMRINTLPAISSRKWPRLVRRGLKTKDIKSLLHVGIHDSCVKFLHAFSSRLMVWFSNTPSLLSRVLFFRLDFLLYRISLI